MSEDRPSQDMPHPDKDEHQSPGREKNAAQPLDAGKTHGGPERYPSVRPDDGIDGAAEGRSFDPRADAPTPRQGAGDGPASVNAGRLGPEADPAEGRRD